MSYDEILADVLVLYREQLTRDANELQRAWEAATSQGDAGALRELTHRIAGSAATFQLSSIATLARIVNQSLEHGGTAGQVAPDVHGLLNLMRRAADVPSGPIVLPRSAQKGRPPNPGSLKEM